MEPPLHLWPSSSQPFTIGAELGSHSTCTSTALVSRSSLLLACGSLLLSQGRMRRASLAMARSSVVGSPARVRKWTVTSVQVSTGKIKCWLARTACLPHWALPHSVLCPLLTPSLSSILLLAIYLPGAKQGQKQLRDPDSPNLPLAIFPDSVICSVRFGMCE